MVAIELAMSVCDAVGESLVGAVNVASCWTVPTYDGDVEDCWVVRTI